ncbi:unnamed protein product [Linum tenue]|uniref:Cox19-like CHCH family protein n=1 Tax=Linum tenue TaxID=586396 RepID=A0AAV0P757_9ROSI|nr:unnamed protein product [Linum tenue]
MGNSQDKEQKKEESSPPPPPLHRDDADEEDETVKQLGDCSSIYLSLQECLVNTDRNWKACQKVADHLFV